MTAVEFFHAAKKERPDAVLLFRFGDRYEAFGDDAQLVSRVLGVPIGVPRWRTRRGVATVSFPDVMVDDCIHRLAATRPVVVMERRPAQKRSESSGFWGRG